MTKTELKEWMWQWLSAYADQYKFMDEFDAKLDKYTEIMKYTLEQKKPDKDEIIVFKAKNCKLPEIGIWSDLEDPREIYVPANDDAELTKNLEWWMPIK